MKAVMISVTPKICEKVASGDCTILVRKTRPKIDTPFKCYIYATKPKKWFRFSSWGSASDENLWLSNGKVKMCDGFEFWADGKEYEPLCGKVIGEFVCDYITGFKAMGEVQALYNEMKETCLTHDEIIKYANGNKLYYWHISDLVFYDKPRDVGEFYVEGDCDCLQCKKCYWFDKGNGYNVEDDCALAYKGLELNRSLKPITSSPKSWCYVEEKENENE